MKKLVFALILLVSSGAFAQVNQMPSGLEIPENVKQYFVVFFIEDAKAPEKQPDPETMKAHLSTVRTNIESGKYVLAGPFLDHTRIGGMFIVNAATKEEAQQLVSADPIVKKGLVTVEVHPAMLPDLSSLKITYPPKQAQ